MKLSLLTKLSVFVIVFAVFTVGCNEDDIFTISYDSAPPLSDTTGVPAIKTGTGLVYYVIEEGSGPFSVIRRDRIELWYTGRRTNGDIFDSSYRNGSESPDLFNDLGNLIDGFKEGLIGMKEGEVRVLVIPPELAYAESPRGSSTYTLRNDTLVFDIELGNIFN